MTEETAAAAAETIVADTTTTGAAPQGGSSDSGATQTQTAATETTTTTEVSWRDRLAGDDKDFRKRLDRFTDETQFAKSYRALEQKLSSGEYKQVKPYPEKGTPEEISAWRKEQGIPEKPDQYDTSVGDGIVWGETDKPFLDDYLTYAHTNNVSPDEVKRGLRWYAEMQDKARARLQEEDGAFKQQSEDALRADWGSDYRRNVTVAENFINSAPQTVKDKLFGGRTPSGRLFGADPDVLKWLAQVSLDLNPAASVLPATGSEIKGLGDRISEIEKMMRDRSGDYYRGPNAKKLQDEYIQLVAARDKMNTRAA